MDSRKPLLACHPRPAHNGAGDGVDTPVGPAVGNKASFFTAADGTTSCDNGPKPKPRNFRVPVANRTDHWNGASWLREPYERSCE
ncbi:hypothetical protein MRX96_036740 [Rhipicephalus microplus]